LIRVTIVRLAVSATLPALVIRLTVWVGRLWLCLWLSILLLPVSIRLAALLLPRLPIVIAVSAIIPVLVIVVIRNTKAINRRIIVISSSAIVTVIYPHKVSVVVIACSFSQTRSVKTVGSSTVTIADVKIRVSITICPGIYHTAWVYIIAAPYHWPVNVKRVVAQIWPPWAADIVDIIHLYPVTGNTFNVVNTWACNIPAVVIGVVVAYHITAAIKVNYSITRQIVIKN